MDSDDDFNSSMSGDDFDDQDSDLDLEEGAYPSSCPRGSSLTLRRL
jgi:hypothetical protein